MAAGPWTAAHGWFAGEEQLDDEVVSQTGPAGPNPYESDWDRSNTDASRTDCTSCHSCYSDDDGDDARSASSVQTRHSEEYPYGRRDVLGVESRAAWQDGGAAGACVLDALLLDLRSLLVCLCSHAMLRKSERRSVWNAGTVGLRALHADRQTRGRGEAYLVTPLQVDVAQAGNGAAMTVQERGGGTGAVSELMDTSPQPAGAHFSVQCRGPEPLGGAALNTSSANEHGNPVEPSTQPITRQAARQPCPRCVSLQSASLPNIQEHEQEPSHVRDSLEGIVARYNTMDCAGGPIAHLLKRSQLGLAYANVPNSSMIWTSRPLTALWTRWQFSVFLLLLAVALLIGQSQDLASLFHNSNMYSVRWLKVETIRVYENPFPDLALEQSSGNVPENGRLSVVDCGFFVSGNDLALDETCNTTLTSDESFEIRCLENVEVHGFWVRVAGSSAKLKGSRLKHQHLPHYDFAGLQYSYIVGSADSEIGARQPPNTGDVYNVMGTGQTIRGKIWDVVPSRSELEGLYRVPMAELPLLQRPLRTIMIAVAYLVVSLILVVASVIGLVGRNVAAKNLTVLASFMAACFSLITAVDDTCVVLRPNEVGKVLVGRAHKVRLDLTCEGVPPEVACADKYGLDTAIPLVMVHYLHAFLWLALAVHMWRETNFILGSFCIMAGVGCVELLLVSLHPHLASPGNSYLCIACLLLQALWFTLERRTRVRVKDIMRADQEFYEEWFSMLIEDEHHGQILADLRREVAFIRDEMLAGEIGTNYDVDGISIQSGSGDAGNSTSSAVERNGHVQAARTSGNFFPEFAWPGPRCVWRWQRCALARREEEHESVIVRPGKVYGTRLRHMMVAPSAITDVQEISDYQGMLFENRFDFFVNVTTSISKPRDIFSMRMNAQGNGSMLKICTSLDSLYEQASCLRPILQKKVEQHVGATPNASRIGGTLQTPLKDPIRAVEKTHRVYGDDSSLLLDVCREFLVFEDLSDLVAMLKRLRQDPELIIMRIKNRLDPRYNSALSAGYRDVLVNVRIENSESVKLNVSHHIAELQLIPRAVYDRRSNGCGDRGHSGSRGEVPLSPVYASAGRTGGLERQVSAASRPIGHNNYVLWRNLRGR